MEFENVEEIEPLSFEHQGNMDDWLILEKIEITESTFRKKDVSLEGLELNVRVDHNIKNIGEDGYEIISY